ncbi:MAG: hypothetical protein H0X39_00070 [Actinobacteria bacterium]|nr:hypothetical protein [Actinomycetota bacterium]
MATIAELQEKLRFENYRRFLRIEDRRSGKMVVFEPNSVQRRIRAEIVSSLRAQQPVRIIILKSRRMGVSTVIQASFAHFAFTTRRFSAITGAHLDESSEYLHGMTEQMYDNLPPALKLQKKTGLRGKRIAFTSGSSLRTFTAGGRSGVGRGTGTRAIHASEVAFWPDARSTLLALRQIVPNEPGTFVILESTAHGVGDTFHEEWQRAVDGRSEYTPLFFAWYEFEDYQLADHQLLGELDDDEVALERIGVTDAQLAWRRHTIANECGGSLDMFHQEYPATPEEAFLSSGRPYFHGLDQVIVEAPKLRGEIIGAPVKGGGVLRFVENPYGPLRIWKSKQPGRRYVIGADVAGSTILAEHDARPVGSKADAYCAYVVDTDTGVTVASLHGVGWTEDEYALKLAQVGRLYNDAHLAVEKNGGYGTATIILLRQRYAYPNLYTHLDEDSTSSLDETGAFGYPMSSTTRPTVLATLSEALRDRPGAFRDADLVREMRTFVWNDRGRPEADTGAHDDRVMAMAITQHVRNLRATRPIRPAGLPAKKHARVNPITRRAPRPRSDER